MSELFIIATVAIKLSSAKDMSLNILVISFNCLEHIHQRNSYNYMLFLILKYIYT